MRKALLLFTVLLMAVPAFPQSMPGTGHFLHIKTATTTTVSAQAGVLMTVTINGGTTGAVTVYDIAPASCTGTPAAASAIGVIQAVTVPITLTYNAIILNGVCVLTAAATDLTVVFN